VISTNCERRLSGRVNLRLVVDSAGKAQNIGFIKSAASDIDRLAIVVAQMDRFTPARQSNNAVATGASLELQLEGCVAPVSDGQGQQTHRLLLSTTPEQTLKPLNSFPSEVVFADTSMTALPKSESGHTLSSYRVGGSVAAPTAIDAPRADYPPQGKVMGECMITLLVDVFGLPQDLVVVRSLSPSMDQKALEAVSRYRFKPAIRDGMEPVPVRVTIAVNFR
jgi:TonB family protein